MEKHPNQLVVRVKVNRSMADPLRVRIFELLAEKPLSAKELGREVGMPADRLYYHLEQLEASGLVRVKSFRPRRVYELAIDVEQEHAPVRVDGDSPDPVGRLGALLEITRIEAEAATRLEGRGRVQLVRTTLRLRKRDVGELNRKIRELVDEFTALSTDRGRAFRFVAATYPLEEGMK